MLLAGFLFLAFITFNPELAQLQNVVSEYCDILVFKNTNRMTACWLVNNVTLADHGRHNGDYPLTK